MEDIATGFEKLRDYTVLTGRLIRLEATYCRCVLRSRRRTVELVENPPLWDSGSDVAQVRVSEIEGGVGVAS